MSPLASSRLHRSRAVDRLVAALITVGGSSVLLAVAFLMIFLVAQCLPLLRTGSAKAVAPVLEGTKALAALEDEYRSSVSLLGEDGAVHVVPRSGPSRLLGLDGVQPPVRQARTDAAGTLLALEDASGAISVWVFVGEVKWHGNTRAIEPSLRRIATKLGHAGAPILAVAGDLGTPAVLVASSNGATLLTGTDDAAASVGLILASPPRVGAVASDGSQVWVASGRELALFFVGGQGDSVLTAQASVPLAVAPTVAAMVIGDFTLLLGDEAGNVNAWQAVTGAVAGSKVLDLAGTFAGRGAVRALAVSQRDKAFLVERTGGASIAYLTSRRTLLSIPEFPSDAALIGISPRRDGLFAARRTGVVHRWGLDLAYPEATAATLLLPTRYEGFTKPELAWQSTGGSASFESKLSLIPLVAGTLKGALYALLFSAPCALAAALFVSQFAPVTLRQLTKPVIELMAAVPSVVVGFLAALFFAPLLQHHIVGTFALLVFLPVAVVGTATLWQAAPLAWRRRMTPSRELALVAGLLAVACVSAFTAEKEIERVLFAGDLKGWLLSAAGITYDQRNAVVVGFALGFAVIPIIFTLAEDAFSNVPPSLISASLALGASRWQAARTVAIPAASPGLFAAVMTGLGRAVGETMIVLMATGNTPILSFSPFNGMRTMSACIAVELPEAPYGGTLYRVLILTALLLFVMTFVINTAAVMVSNRLRKRFGRLAA
jgi:phosphate transport system permease protein